LQCAQVVGVTEFRSQLLEDAPVTLLPFLSDLALEVAHEISDNAVVVQQRIIDV
jgi:hypothetical protein